MRCLNLDQVITIVIDVFHNFPLPVHKNIGLVFVISPVLLETYIHFMWGKNSVIEYDGMWNTEDSVLKNCV